MMDSVVTPTAGEISFLFHGASVGIVTTTIVIIVLIIIGRNQTR